MKRSRLLLKFEGPGAGTRYRGRDGPTADPGRGNPATAPSPTILKKPRRSMVFASFLSSIASSSFKVLAELVSTAVAQAAISNAVVSISMNCRPTIPTGL